MRTDKEKTNEQIRNSNFKGIEFDPTSSHIQKVKQFLKKRFRESELSQEWVSFIVNPNADITRYNYKNVNYRIEYSH